MSSWNFAVFAEILQVEIILGITTRTAPELTGSCTVGRHLASVGRTDGRSGRLGANDAKLATNAARLYGRQTNGRNIIDHAAQAAAEFEAARRRPPPTDAVRTVLSQIIAPGI